MYMMYQQIEHRGQIEALVIISRKMWRLLWRLWEIWWLAEIMCVYRWLYGWHRWLYGWQFVGLKHGHCYVCKRVISVELCCTYT